MRRALLWLPPAVALALPLGLALSYDDGAAPSALRAQAGDDKPREGPRAVAQMQDRQGNGVGEVRFAQKGDALKVKVKLENLELEPGLYGFHLHETGQCDAQAEDGPFTTAGSHHNPDDDAHGEHAGDFPPLLVKPGGEATASFSTDRLELGELTAGDGTAVMLHMDRDNLAHIPDRYRADDSEQAGPDEETRNTGDAGGRFACGVVRAEQADEG